MPQLDDIEQFKQVLDSLGAEKEIQDEKGEKIEDIPPPEQGLSADLTDLLGISDQEIELNPPAHKDEPPASADRGTDIPLSDLENLAEFNLPPESAAPEFQAESPPAAGQNPDSADQGTEIPLSDLANLAEFNLPPESGAPEFQEEFPPAAGQKPDSADQGTEIPLSDLADLAEFNLPPESGPAPFQEEALSAPGPQPDEGLGFELPKELEQELAQAGEGQAGPEQTQAFSAEPIDIEQFNPPSADANFTDFESTGQQGAEIPPAKEEAAGEFELPDISDITEPLPPDKGGAAQAPEEDIFAGLTDLDGGTTPPAESPLMEETAPAPETKAAAPGIEMPPLEKGEPEDFALDEFSLPDFGAEQQVVEEAQAPPQFEAAPATEEEYAAPPVTGELYEAAEDIKLSDKEFKNLQDTLAGLPLNLKLIIEELIGVKGLKGNNLRQLLDLLIEGGTPREIATFVSDLIGKKIVLPKRFEKKTGVAFEREKESLAYILKRKLTPALLVVVVGLFAILALSLFGYQFIYRPLAALAVYQEGFDKVMQGDYLAGNQKFEEAVQIWDYKDQYYRFAEAFRQKEQYKFAEQKYETLLKKYPFDEKGALDYADLLSFKGSYKEANTILSRHILDKDLFHFQGLLAAGDNFLRWGDKEPARYEDALRAYQQLHERYPEREQVMFRLLNYFIHVNNPVQVAWYKNYFKDRKFEPVDPEIYTKLAGYLLDRKELDDVKDILDKARSADGELPEVYYELGRFYGLIHETSIEGEVLKATPDIFTNYFAKHPDKKTTGRTAMLIKAHNSLGEYYYKRKDFQELPKAENEFLEAIRLYEIEKRNKNLGMDKSFGKIYANLGDIYYHADENFTLALEMYNQAEDNLYNDPEVKYKKGYIYYQRNDLENALFEFYGASADMRDNHAVIFALANTLYKRKAFSSALGNYIYLIGLLEDEKNAIPILRPEDNPLHNALMEKEYIVYNNLGVAYFQLGRNLSQPEKETQALVELERSAEIFDVLSRNPDTMARLQSTNTATESNRIKKAAPEPYANMDIIMHSKDLDLVIYEDLPMDVSQARLRKKDQL